MQQHLFWRHSRPFTEQVFLVVIHLSSLADRYNLDPSFSPTFIAFIAIKASADSNLAALSDILTGH